MAKSRQRLSQAEIVYTAPISHYENKKRPEETNHQVFLLCTKRMLIYVLNFQPFVHGYRQHDQKDLGSFAIWESILTLF